MNAPEPFVDIHCHLLPDLDDGARSYDDALSMARMAVTDGIRVIIATPHQLGSYTHNEGDEIRRRVAQLQQFLEDHRVPLRVLPGADVRVDGEMFALLRGGRVLTLGDHGRHVLLELPHELYLPLDDALDNLHRLGMVGVLSHPERNQGLLRQPRLVEPLVERGCLMQITAGSLTGTFGDRARAMAEWLLERDLVHFVATDAHGPNSRRPLLGAAHQRVAELVGRERADRLCRINPGAVARGEVVPRMARRRRARRLTEWLGWHRAA